MTTYQTCPVCCDLCHVEDLANENDHLSWASIADDLGGRLCRACIDDVEYCVDTDRWRLRKDCAGMATNGEWFETDRGLMDAIEDIAASDAHHGSARHGWENV